MKFIALGLLLAVLPGAASAYTGGTLRTHGHTSNTDGGRLTNALFTGTATVQGSAFSVGGATLSVSAGRVTLASTTFTGSVTLATVSWASGGTMSGPYRVDIGSSVASTPNDDCQKAWPAHCFITASTATVTTTRASSMLKASFTVPGYSNLASGCYIDLVVDGNYASLIACAINQQAVNWTMNCVVGKRVTAGTHTVGGLIATNGGGGQHCYAYGSNAATFMVLEEMPE